MAESKLKDANEFETWNQYFVAALSGVAASGTASAIANKAGKIADACVEEALKRRPVKRVTGGARSLSTI